MTTRFPEKAAELWAYQTTIIHAAHTYEGANWVAYDRLYRREMLAAKNLNWSIPNQRLYSEAFTGRAKKNPQCPHCLSEDHAAAGCPHNPYPPVVGWFQGATNLQFGPTALSNAGIQPSPKLQREVCRNFNGGRCRFSRCRYLHVCSDCSGPHSALLCPYQQSTSRQAAMARSRSPARPRLGRRDPTVADANRGPNRP